MACAGSVGPGGHPWRQLGVTGYPSQEGTIEWARPHLVTGTKRSQESMQRERGGLPPQNAPAMMNSVKTHGAGGRGGEAILRATIS